MTSTRERQRAAARAKLEREMAQRKAAARKRRQRLTILGAGATVIVVLAGVVWLVVALNDDDPDTASPAPSASAGAAPCTFTEVPADQRPKTTKDVGLPPSGEPREGTEVMKLATNFGDIEITMDLAKSPCTAASFRHLASKDFFDGIKCHRILPGLLQCGDPSAKGKGYRETDGTGGPSYRFADENLPTNERPPYPAGVVAMANSGPNTATNGSQFFLVYQDVELQPAYGVVGKITDPKGMEVLKSATAAGHDGAFEPQPGGGHPKKDVVINDLTVG
ncbi:peptidylprolyl isomerase [Actinophytocola sp.]|uniref:peptidylprolyl isomerase n=1 Tax=Actinophytocola sp. TaxID=1872138 RepID=UPI002D80C260|nr:peptidylprolyl isomerase [Actinophytocola sp.]HET9142784.1 peptidylprolyl isomerase [Actinophytocola sp.]HEU5109572.1 peptidylprolyl isomerase [Micromonosporaceae bacterium]